jgi:hypothetical protein
MPRDSTTKSAALPTSDVKVTPAPHLHHPVQPALDRRARRCSRYGTTRATKSRASRSPTSGPLRGRGVNTAGNFFAQERDAYHKPTGRLVAYREYRAGDRSAAEHCYYLMSRERGFPRHHEKEPGRAEEEKTAEGGLNGGRRSHCHTSRSSRSAKPGRGISLTRAQKPATNADEHDPSSKGCSLGRGSRASRRARAAPSQKGSGAGSSPRAAR